jgi:hypothetical protein
MNYYKIITQLKQDLDYNMPTSSGPRNSAKSNLVYCMDTYDTSNCVTPLGCGGWNGSTQGIKNILTGVTALYQNGLRISNRDFYTVFAIDYPEGSYGGDAAGRQGITPGYNVRSGGKIFNYGRALNYAVWDDTSKAWVKFTVYDSYVGTAAVDTFVAEYYQMVAQYPNAVHVVAGSHRDSYHTSAEYTILRDLGAPSNVDSIIGFSSPEWILVGKPGLGAGNAYGWAFQNYTTNPDQVANMNMSVTPKTLGALSFDGTDDYLSVANSDAFKKNIITLELIIKFNSFKAADLVQFGVGSGAYAQWYFRDLGNGNFNWFIWGLGVSTYSDLTVSRSSLTTGKYYHIVCTAIAGTSTSVYYNGTLAGSAGSTAYNTAASWTPAAMTIGGFSWDGYSNTDIAVVNIYDKVLSTTEIQNNYRQYKTRFNLS